MPMPGLLTPMKDLWSKLFRISEGGDLFSLAKSSFSLLYKLPSKCLIPLILRCEEEGHS